MRGGLPRPGARDIDGCVRGINVSAPNAREPSICRTGRFTQSPDAELQDGCLHLRTVTRFGTRADVHRLEGQMSLSPVLVLAPWRRWTDVSVGCHGHHCRSITDDVPLDHEHGPALTGPCAGVLARGMSAPSPVSGGRVREPTPRGATAGDGFRIHVRESCRMPRGADGESFRPGACPGWESFPPVRRTGVEDRLRLSECRGTVPRSICPAAGRGRLPGRTRTIGALRALDYQPCWETASTPR